MTDDSLADVQSDRVVTVGPAIRAALSYIDGLHAFAVAVVRCDIDGMREAVAKVDAAAKIIAAQSFAVPADAR